MKKKMTLLALLAAFSLAACGDPKASPSASAQPSASDTSAALSSAESSADSSAESSSLPSETSSSVPAESSSQSASETSSSSSQEAVTYTAEQVAADVTALFTDAGYANLAPEWDTQYQEYYTSVSLGADTDDSSAHLAAGAAQLASFLPEYMLNEDNILAIDGDPNSANYYDYYGDGSKYYAYMFYSPDEKVCVVIIASIYNGNLIVELTIYDVPDQTAE